MEKELDKLLEYAKSINFKVSDLAEYINETLSFECYSELEGDEPEDKAHYFVLKYKKQETLQEKEFDFTDTFKETLEKRLQKAEAEVKRLQEAIENIKIKAGDWVIVNEAELIFKASDYDVKNIDSKRLYRNVKKIQDTGLISKLNELIK